MTLIVDEAFARVKVLAKRFVVVKAFEAYMLPITCRLAVGVTVPMPTLLLVVLKNMFAVDVATPEL